MAQEIYQGMAVRNAVPALQGMYAIFDQAALAKISPAKQEKVRLAEQR